MKLMMDVRFNMRATIVDIAGRAVTPNPQQGVVPTGHWETIQDDITGALQRIWVEDQAVVPQYENVKPETITRFDIECYVRGFPEVGFRSSANTENWEDGIYQAMESIQMYYPAKYVLNRRQFVSNIRKNNIALWVEEETGQPTVFEVQGATPTFDPFGRHIDNLAVLKRAEIQ